MWSLFDYMRDYGTTTATTTTQTTTISTSIVDPFVKLPSKRIYPDYFEEIKQPISLNQIKSKLHKRMYASLSDLNRDFMLMFANAMQYNVEESVIYGHAKELKRVFEEKSAQVAAQLEATGSGLGGEATTMTTSGSGGGGGGGGGGGMMTMMLTTPNKYQYAKKHQQHVNEMVNIGGGSGLGLSKVKKVSYDVNIEYFYSF
jgi:hypothetical protein